MEHPFVQFIVLGLAVVAFILALKALASTLPDSGPLGAAKSVVSSI